MTLPADYAFRIASSIVTSDRAAYVNSLFNSGRHVAEVDSFLCCDAAEAAQRLHQLTDNGHVKPREQYIQLSTSPDNIQPKNQDQPEATNLKIPDFIRETHFSDDMSTNAQITDGRRQKLSRNDVLTKHKDRRRDTFSSSFPSREINVLCRHFSYNRYANHEQRKRLADDLNMSPEAISVNIFDIILLT